MPSQAIVLIPGIKGTKLVNTSSPAFDTIWSVVQSNVETIEDLEFTKPIDNRYYEEEPTTIIRPGEVEGLAYSEFVRDLSTDKPIYVYSYDWRLSAVHNAERFAVFVDELISKSKASIRMATITKIDVVTHSLGNLILRAYIKQHGFGKINKVVFTVPPFKGSLEIVSTLVAGEGLFRGTRVKSRKLIRTFPGALELLPTYDGAGRFVSGYPVDFFKKEHWQRNITATKNVTPSKRLLATKFRNALQVAKASVDDALVDPSRMAAMDRRNMLVIARTGYETLQSLSVTRHPSDDVGNYFDLRNATRTLDGDGTVPHASSCCYHESIQTLMVSNDWLYREHGHAFILNDERIQRLVSRFLSPEPFSHRSPGRSVRRVIGLEPEPDGSPYTSRAILES